MRPEGCQETHPRSETPRFPATHRFQTSFWPERLDAAENGDLYSFDDCPAHSRSDRRSPDRRAAADAGAPGAGRSALDLRERPRRRAALRCPTSDPSDFVVREDNLAREVLRVGPADDADAASRCWWTPARPRRANIRDIREAATAFIKARHRRPTVKHQVALIGIGERPTVLVDYTSDQARLLKGIGLVFANEQSGAYLLDGIIEASKGFKKREAQRPVIVAIATEGPEFSNRYHDQVLSAAARCRRVLPHRHDRAAAQRPDDAGGPRARDDVLDGAPRRPADATTTSWPRAPCPTA